MSVHLLMERVVDVMAWDLLEPSIDSEMLPISSEHAAQTWPEAAELLDAHASHLDQLSTYLAAQHSSIHEAQCRRIARVLRADIARAIELGDRERAARRLACMLDAARQLMRAERLIVDRSSGSGILRTSVETFDEVGADHFDADTVRPALDRLSNAQLSWLTLSAHQQRLEDDKQRLASLYKAHGVDPRNSLDTPNALPAAFEGTWIGDLTVRHGDDRVFPRVRLVIDRNPRDPRLASVQYISSNHASDWFAAEQPDAAAHWGDGEPSVEYDYTFQKEDRASEIWIRVVERSGNDGVEYEPVRSTHLTLFSGHRIQIIDLTPMGLSAVGTVMTLQLAADGSIDFEVQTLEARTITSMPAAHGLWTGRLERVD
ncbi:MAG: hypothetical protein AAFS11_01890 [Planctomycetota bacterium]